MPAGHYQYNGNGTKTWIYASGKRGATIPTKSRKFGGSSGKKYSEAPAKSYQYKKTSYKKAYSKPRAEDMSTGDLIAEGASRLGKLALKTVPAMLGFGDYVMPTFKPEENSLMKQITSNGPPAMHSIGREVRICHREYLGDIITGSAGAFTIQSYALNPGLFSTFPWLSAIAQNFEQYRINGMVWEFKSTSADALNSTNTALGTVIMCTEYNASANIGATFANKQQMENHEFCSSARQSCSMLHPIECKKSLTPISELFVRAAAVPAGQDARLYDMGTFAIATVGQQGSNINIGELWCSYDISLLKPQLDSALGYEILSDHYSSTTSISTTNYFGTSQTLRSGSNIGSTITGNVYNFPANISEGQFMVVWWVGGTSSASTQPTIIPTNCTVLQMWYNDQFQQLSSGSNTTTQYGLVFMINITASGAKFNFTGGSLPSSITSMDLFVTQVNANLSS